MKQITILWMERKIARIIVATPSDIVEDHLIESHEPELPAQGATPDYRKTKNDSRQDYFKRIADKVNTTYDTVIFGSDNSKEEFLEYLSKNNEGIFNRVIGVEASGDMPEEKIIARGRKYI